MAGCVNWLNSIILRANNRTQVHVLPRQVIQWQEGSPLLMPPPVIVTPPPPPATDMLKQIASANGTTDINTVAAWASTGLSITLTMQGTNAIIIVTFNVTGGSPAYARINRDAGAEYQYIPEQTGPANLSGAVIFAGLSLASHTFTLEWQNGNLGTPAVVSNCASAPTQYVRRMILLDVS